MCWLCLVYPVFVAQNQSKELASHSHLLEINKIPKKVMPILLQKVYYATNFLQNIILTLAYKNS